MDNLESGTIKVYRGGQLVLTGSFSIQESSHEINLKDIPEFNVSFKDINMIEDAIQRKDGTVQTKDDIYKIVYE